MNNPIQFRCCICGDVVYLMDADGHNTDSYTLQVWRPGSKSPEAMWAHGPCLRKVIPVVDVEIPGA